jgi:hypothetical protein
MSKYDDMNVYERRNYPVISLLKYRSYYITRLSLNQLNLFILVINRNISGTNKAKQRPLKLCDQ